MLPFQPVLRHVAHPHAGCKELCQKVLGLGTFFWVYDPQVDPLAPQRVPLWAMSREERVGLSHDAYVIAQTIAETLAPTRSPVG
jgi:hypothetical protein